MPVIKRYSGKNNAKCIQFSDPKPNLIAPLVTYVCYFEENLYRLVSANSFSYDELGKVTFYRVYRNEKGSLFQQPIAMFLGASAIYDISSDVEEEMKKFQMGFAYKPTLSSRLQEVASDNPPDSPLLIQE